MNIKIAHLYYDLLNLYGEVGNVLILKKALEDQGVKITIDQLTISNELDFSKYDFVFMGMGIIDNVILASEHLSKYKKQLKQYIENGGYLLATGNSYEMFGKLLTLGNKTIKMLNLFDFESETVSERKIMEVSAKSSFADGEIIGFMNTGSFNNNQTNNFLTIKDGTKELNEGILYKNLICTYTIGPLLSRNPQLLEKIVKSLVESKNNKYKIKPFTMPFVNEAYQETLKRRLANETY